MTVIDPAVTLQVSENDKVLEPYRVCWPTQKIPSVRKLTRYVSRCGASLRSTSQTTRSEPTAPGSHSGRADAPKS